MGRFRPHPARDSLRAQAGQAVGMASTSPICLARKPMHMLSHATGAPVADNQNILTAEPRGPALLQDIWPLEKLAHFECEVIPERRMHAKGSGAFGRFTVTHDITAYTRAKLFSQAGKSADAERDIRGVTVKFYSDEGDRDLVGNNTPVFFMRDPRTSLRSAQNNWDFWTLVPEALHQVTYVMGDRGLSASYHRDGPMHVDGNQGDTIGYDCIKAFSETDFTEDLKRFDVPTLVIHGDDDQIVPIGGSAMLSSKLVKNAVLKIYPGGAHALADTSKDKLNADLLAFLKS
jgi:pimeloyl-ACP methyl ester carboxylesterase